MVFHVNIFIFQNSGLLHLGKKFDGMSRVGNGTDIYLVLLIENYNACFIANNHSNNVYHFLL